MMKAEIEQLVEMEACHEAIAWLRSLNGTTTPQQAWDACECADWMLWLLERTTTDDDKPKLVRIACECARLALPHYEREYPDDNRVRNCIETVERWLEGNATDDELQTAARAAWEAAEVAARAAEVAAWAAARAAWEAAEVAAEVAAWAAALVEMQKQCADIVRKYFPDVPQLTAKERE